MKKLSLNASAFQKGEVLTRSQLKNVFGGTGSGEGSEEDVKCNDSNECSEAGLPCGTGDKGTCKNYGCGSGVYFQKIRYCIMP